jgi:sugar phosphate isomerase/epimerase
MSRSLYVSTNCFRDRSPEGILSAAREGGWTHVELSAVRATTTEASALARRLHAEGVRVLLHNYFPPPREPFVLNLASRDLDVRRRSRRHCEEALVLSAELDAPFFAAHAGFVADLPPSLLGDPAAQRRFCQEGKGLGFAKEASEIFAESVKGLIDFGRRHGVQFLVENHVAGEDLGADAARSLLLMLDAEEVGALARQVGADDFGLLLDVGHLRCTSRVVGFSEDEFCRAVSPWVRAFHLSDNDGRRDSHQPFGEGAWFLDVVASLPDAAATLEFDRCSAEELSIASRVVRSL